MNNLKMVTDRRKHQFLSEMCIETELFWGNFNLYSILASGAFCRLLITFANSLGPDQDQQNVGPELDLNHLTL